ncbi:hypothetical protein GGQ73_001798 [Rhizobium skierniewicense]|uniref:Uncharacterized protein n=1 Tax=Rhizobium skierniewicense TaxID=984260 RepID=A0A7W6C527_9HYPH|nr:hypothetical protein [Rhizobium skierniewicense]
MHTEMAACEGKTLRVVASRRAHENPVFARGGDGLAEKIERASDLVGTNRREIFTLQPDLGSIPAAQMFIQLQRRFGKQFPNFPPCGLYKHFIHDFQSIEFHDGTRYAIGKRMLQRLFAQLRYASLNQGSIY